jgi:hypothetical protein
VTFTIYNEGQQAFDELARPTATDVAIIAAGGGGGRTGVVAGCEVTESTPPGISVVVADGTMMIDGVRVDLTGDEVVLDSPHPTLKRLDLILGGDDGVPYALAGLGDTIPLPPSYSPALGAALAMVLVQADDSGIVHAQIVPKDFPVSLPLGESQWNTTTANDQATAGTRSNTATLAPDSIIKIPLVANTRYRFRAKLWFDVKASSDLKFRITGPATPDRLGIRGGWFSPTTGLAQGGFARTAYWTADTVVAFTTNVTVLLEFDGFVHNGPNAGDLAFEWAQLSAVAEDTIRIDGSYIEYEVI